MKGKKMMSALTAALAASMLAATAASGASLVGGGYGDGPYHDSEVPHRAVSYINPATYINPDDGEANENRDVNDNSSCSSPDRYDAQARSFPGSTAKSVHNSACFFGAGEGGKLSTVDAPATFESSGRGYISDCPDPDGAGLKFARLSDRNRDGRIDACLQSGYQDMGVPGIADRPGDFQYHVRVNETTNRAAGEQRVAWGYDPDADGLSDTNVKDAITVLWK